MCLEFSTLCLCGIFGRVRKMVVGSALSCTAVRCAWNNFCSAVTWRVISTIIVLGNFQPKCCPAIWGSTINQPYRIMRQIEMRRVKRGEFFRLANSESAPVWVRDEYNRSSKKFEAYKYDNVNYWSEFKGSRLVYVDFVF